MTKLDSMTFLDTNRERDAANTDREHEQNTNTDVGGVRAGRGEKV